MRARESCAKCPPPPLSVYRDGKKMSKRLKNYPDPNHVLSEYGADALRLYLINSPVVRAETLRFKEEGVKGKSIYLVRAWVRRSSFVIALGASFA